LCGADDGVFLQDIPDCRGPRTLRWVYLQVLRELAQPCGHADILRELVLAE